MTFKYPSPTIARINLRPLVPPRALENLNVAKVLRSLQRETLKQIRHKILQETFSDRAKKALYYGVSVQIGPSSIKVIAKHPAFRPLVEGQKPRQMRWLLKARRPIPIITETGELIFRSATPRSMDNGSWYHPGRQPTTIIERARKEAREVLKVRLAKSLRQQIRAAFLR